MWDCRWTTFEIYSMDKFCSFLNGQILKLSPIVFHFHFCRWAWPTAVLDLLLHNVVTSLLFTGQHPVTDFWVGEWTTLEKNSNFRNFSRVFSKFRVEDGTFLLLCLRIRVLWFFCYFLVRERTKSRIFIFSAKSTTNYSNVS